MLSTILLNKPSKHVTATRTTSGASIQSGQTDNGITAVDVLEYEAFFPVVFPTKDHKRIKTSMGL